MATKEDILEQIVEEYLLHRGYFVQHNVKFLPAAEHPEYVRLHDSNHSDIDVIGLNPHRSGPERVLVVSCKSWQGGFDPRAELRAIQENRKIRGREAWKGFRELTSQKWSKAFCRAIFDLTGETEFTYLLAVAHLRGSPDPWETHLPFLEAINGNPIRIVPVKDMLIEIERDLGTTLAATEVGRLLQMFKAAKIKVG